MRKIALLAALVAVGASVLLSEVARADVIVNSTDDNYGSFMGTIPTGAGGAAAVLNWNTATYGTIFTVDFTNASNTITDVLFSPSGVGSPVYPGDALQFDGFLSGDAAIGTQCVAGGSVFCIVATGGVQDLTSLISSLNGGEGIFVDGDLNVVVADATVAVPEPTTLALLLAGLAGLGLVRRRRAVI